MTDPLTKQEMSLQDQLRRLTSGGPGVTFIASETLFEDSAAMIDSLESENKQLRAERDRWMARAIPALRDEAKSDKGKTYTERCPRCRGQGHEPGLGHDIAPGAHQPCQRCKGTGEVQWMICPTCEGGAAFSPADCTDCDGVVRIEL